MAARTSTVAEAEQQKNHFILTSIDQPKGTTMKTMISLFAATLLMAGAAHAQDSMSKDAMKKDAMKKDAMQMDAMKK